MSNEQVAQAEPAAPLNIPADFPSDLDYSYYSHLCMTWGKFGSHRIYVGKKGSGIFMCVMAILGFGFVVAGFVAAIVFAFIGEFLLDDCDAFDIFMKFFGGLMGVGVAFCFMQLELAMVLGSEEIAWVLVGGIAVCFLVSLLMARADRKAVRKANPDLYSKKKKKKK